MNKILSAITLMLVSASASAAVQVPEPGTLALFGLGGVVLLAAALKRKK